MDLLENAILEYAWGSRTALPSLLRRNVPSNRPQAELWMGAHPSAPSKARRDGVWRSLLELIAVNPARELGPAVERTYGSKLPFLLKVLAAAEPLSLQAHPTLEQAQAGFDREEAAGVPREAPQRLYKDRNHKPELLAALEPTDALCGFRPVAETAALFESLGVAALAEAVARLRAGPPSAALRSLLERWLSLERDAAAKLASEVCGACARPAAESRFGAERRWAVRLGEKYPGDVGAVCALLLNLVRLEPGEAIELPAGRLHAYLNGVGVEIMASSDNVLRGGLTPKHIDVAELLRVLDFTDAPAKVLRPVTRDDGEEVYPSRAREYRLSRWRGGPGRALTPRRLGAEILICVQGDVTLDCAAGSLALGQGQSAFVAAGDGPYTLSGEGVAFRATIGSAGADFPGA